MRLIPRKIKDVPRKTSPRLVSNCCSSFWKNIMPLNSARFTPVTGISTTPSATGGGLVTGMTTLVGGPGGDGN